MLKTLDSNIKTKHTNLDHDTLIKLEEISKVILPYEEFWVQKLLQSKEAEPILGSEFIRRSNIGSTDNHHNKKPIRFAKKLFKKIVLPCGVDENFIKTTIASILIYFYKLENIGETTKQYSIGFVTSFLQQLPNNIKLFFPEYVPLILTIAHSTTISELIKNIDSQIATLELYKAYFIDLHIRYNNEHYSTDKLDNTGCFVNYHNCNNNIPIVIEINDVSSSNDCTNRHLKNEKATTAMKVDTIQKDPQLIFTINSKDKTCIIEISDKFLSTDSNLSLNSLIEHLSKCLLLITGQIITLHDRSKTINDLSLLTKEEKEQILVKWNDTRKVYQDIHNKTIVNIFEEQVEKTPDNIAVIYGDTQLTYSELNARVNRLAHHLRSLGVRPGVLVAIAVERSLEMIIGLLGILKSGGAYVPLDPDYPDERLKFILDDTKAMVLITQEQVIEEKKGILGDIINSQDNNIDHNVIGITLSKPEIEKLLESQSSTNPSFITLPHHLAYVIYTSGSTGKPKGVMIEHDALCNFLIGIRDNINITHNDKFLSITNITFDIAALELYIPIITGASLVISRKDLIFIPISLVKLLKNTRVTVMQATPTAWQMLLDYLTQISNLKITILCGGEISNLNLIKNLISVSANTWNLYGPTEATIWSSAKLYSSSNDPNEITTVSIGRPISNTQIYILDRFLNPVPALVPGQIYIGGAGLARGYLNRPDLTAEKFMPNPFGNKENLNYHSLRLYSTGDIARYLSDGNIEFLGRIDDQVKIKGLRIELGEIETVLSSYRGIKQNVVLCKERKGTKGMVDTKYLVAYYIKEQNTIITDANHSNFIGALHDIYQLQYSLLDINNFKLNTNIWISSYSGKPVDKIEMVEWTNETVKRIKTLNPRIVLEIGSGSGLVLFNIIDDCDYYYATDFSSNVIDYTNTVAEKFGYISKVEAISCAADKIPYHELKKPYDTVIINSVVMHFPNLEYLELVITQIIFNMQTNGKIFIGDVRDHRLLKCFHYSIQKYRNHYTTKEDIDYFVSKDKDLVISPEYFINLQTFIKDIVYVEVMPRFGNANNEMNNYRYDVIIHIAKNNIDNNCYSTNISATTSLIDIDESEFTNVVNFETYLLSKIEIFEPNKNQDKDVNKAHYLSIKYPNKRIVQDYFRYNKLYNDVGIEEVNYYNELLFIGEILEIIKKHGLNTKILLDIYNPLYLCILVFQNHKTLIYKREWCIKYKTNNYKYRNYSNNPSVNIKYINDKTSEELKKYLSSKLPYYMVPEYYISLDYFPLTINGKLDKKALPEPKFLSQESYIPPKSEVEISICHIWSEVLGLQKNSVGLNDTFFSLGGNSILAITLANKLQIKFNIKVDMLSIFKFNTVNKFIEHLENERTNRISGAHYVF